MGSDSVGRLSVEQIACGLIDVSCIYPAMLAVSKAVPRNCEDETTDTKMDEMWDLACDGDL